MTESRGRQKNFYIVNKEVLPEAILKTAVVKELLAKGEALTVNEAVDRVGISRSAFYKYRDGIFPFYKANDEKIITLSLILEHRTGILSSVLNTVAQMKGNILTINQGIPLQGMAVVTMSMETAEIAVNIAEIIQKLQLLDGLKKVELVGQS